MVDRIPGQWRKLPAQFDSRKLTLQPRQPRAYPDYITHTPSRATLHPISALGVTRRVFYFGTRVSGNFMPVSVRQRTLRCVVKSSMRDLHLAKTWVLTQFWNLDRAEASSRCHQGPSQLLPSSLIYMRCGRKGVHRGNSKL